MIRKLFRKKRKRKNRDNSESILLWKDVINDLQSLKFHKICIIDRKSFDVIKKSHENHTPFSYCIDDNGRAYYLSSNINAVISNIIPIMI